MADRPNILFLLADQYRFDCLSAAGHPVVRTPQLDALSASATRFTRTWCATMACAPARASLFTGLHADGHGMAGNQTTLDPPDRPVLTEHLAAAGYDTALVGKLHLKPIERDYGFRHMLRHDAPYTNYAEAEAADSAYLRFLQATAFRDDPAAAVRRFTEDEACQHTDELRFMLGSGFLDEAHHEVTWAVEASIRYLRTHRDRDRPFFLNTSFFGPHQPYLPPPPWDDLYPPEDLPLPAGFDHTVEDKPIFGASEQLDWRRRRDAQGWGEDVYRRILSAYYGYVSLIDDGVGRILQALRDEGLWDDTLIAFSADHGELGGQFRAFYKGVPYEGACHVPLILRDPRASQLGRVCERAASNMDLFSTFLGAAGVEPDPEVESRDLASLTAGETSTWDDRALWKKGSTSFLVRGDDKLVRGRVAGETVYELYDQDADPLEATNRAGDPARAETLARLRSELDSWHEAQDERARRREGGPRR